MRRVAVVALLALALPIASWASGLDLINKAGSVTISNAGIVTKGSHLVQFGNKIAPPGHAMGHVYFATGALVSGSLQAGGTFSDVGSSFLVTGVGNYGEPKGTIFQGAFVGPIQWTLVSKNGTKLTYTLSGTIKGQIWTGATVTGTTTQTIYSTNGQLALGSGVIHAGGTHLNTPEPGTLGLLGTGLVGIAAMVRRKLASRA